jgi:hypothetical protein
MLARPVTGDQVEVPGELLVELLVVDDQHSLGLLHQRFGLGPERLRVGLQAV